MINDCRSPGTRVLGVLAVVFSIVISPAPLAAQHGRASGAIRTTLDGAKQPNAFAVGDSVEVEYFRRGEWLPGRVTDVVNDGYAYTVDLVPYDDGKIVDAQIHYSRVRAHGAVIASAPRPSISSPPVFAPGPPSSAPASLPRVTATPAAGVVAAIALRPALVACVTSSGCARTTFSVLQQGTSEEAVTPPPTRADSAPPRPSAIPPARFAPPSSPLALTKRFQP